MFLSQPLSFARAGKRFVPFSETKRQILSGNRAFPVIQLFECSCSRAGQMGAKLGRV